MPSNSVYEFLVDPQNRKVLINAVLHIAPYAAENPPPNAQGKKDAAALRDMAHRYRKYGNFTDKQINYLAVIISKHYPNKLNEYLLSETEAERLEADKKRVEREELEALEQERLAMIEEEKRSKRIIEELTEKNELFGMF